MELLNGANKPIGEQLMIFETILRQNETLMKLLSRLDQMELSQYYVGAGAVNQTVFNYYHRYPLNNEIQDSIRDLSIEVDIKNEARVHLWYEQKFGIKINPYQSVEEAISRWGATVTCIGIRLEEGQLQVFAPYGLNDLFQLVIRPVKEDFQEMQYQQRANKWKQKWPSLTVLPWNTK